MSHLPRRTARASSRASHPAASSTVLVTGGSRGIGRAIGLEFGRAGWHVGVHYHERTKEAHDTAEDIRRSGGHAILCRADIRDASQVHAMIRACMTRWGRIDVLVCNAAIASSRLLLRTTNQEWAAILETNLTGAFHCVKAAGRHMLARREGSIIVVSSFAALHGQPGQSAYAATKAGLLGLVKSAAREWGPRNVRINAVLPGWHRTEMSAHAMVEERIVHDHALKRSGDVQAVAQTIYHLARLKDVSGQVWNLDSRIL